MEIEKRAKHRALYLLEHMDRTEYELRKKLEKTYEEEVVEQAIAYVKHYGYINDLEYAKRYIFYKSKTKSQKMICQELLYKKGIEKEVLEEAYAQRGLQNEKALIQKWVEKKKFSRQEATREEAQKMYVFLLRKGFNSDDIRSVLREIDLD